MTGEIYWLFLYEYIFDHDYCETRRFPICSIVILAILHFTFVLLNSPSSISFDIPRVSHLPSLIFSPWLFSESSMCDEQCLINDHQTKNPSLWYNANGRLGFSQRNRLRYFTTLQTYNSSLPPKRHVRLGHEADRKFSSRKASHFIE